MSFTQGLSGLNAASKDLEVIGNNVANVNTVGFKGSQAQFADVFAAALSGAGAAQIGIGTRLATVAQQFTQGTIQITNNSLDMAVNGAGFFVMDSLHGTTYTRNGQFQLDKNGSIVSSTGAFLQGFPADAAGNVQVGSTGPLTVPTGTGNPAASTKITAGVNLDSTSGILPPASFDPTINSSYNNATSITTYDAQGNPQTATMYFVKTAANIWNVYTQVKDTTTGASLFPLDPGPNAPVPGFVPAGGWPTNTFVGTLNYQANGTINLATYPLGIDTAAPGAIPISFPPVSTGLQALALNLSTATQFAGPFSVTTLAQDGYALGNLSGFSIGSNGDITGRYSNGVTKIVGRVALSTFANMQGLQPLGDNVWAETGKSGAPVPNSPGSGNTGVLQTSAVEGSNVDLTAELVNMVTAQRNYQANSQTIKVQDAVFQTLLNLR